jgi:aspartate oxidase
VAATVVDSAIPRSESRGAHQREDHPGMLPEWNVNQLVRLTGSRLDISSAPAAPEMAAQ